MSVPMDVVGDAIDILHCYLAQWRAEQGVEPDQRTWGALTVAATQVLARLLRAYVAHDTAHAYEYYTGTDAAGRAQWSRSPARAVTIAGAPVGQLSVIHDPGLKHWLMTYLQGGHDAVMPSSDNLVIHSAPHYWGPWSQPATLVTHQRYPGLYGAFMNPQFLSDNGHTIYFVMSQWGPYSVFWMRASLAEKRYSRLDRSLVAMRSGKEEHPHGAE